MTAPEEERKGGQDEGTDTSADLLSTISSSLELLTAPPMMAPVLDFFSDPEAAPPATALPVGEGDEVPLMTPPAPLPAGPVSPVATKLGSMGLGAGLPSI
jgi:hypothetical protein